MLTLRKFRNSLFLLILAILTLSWLPFIKRRKVSQETGQDIRVEGLDAFVGEVCEIEIKSTGRIVLSEVVGFVDRTVLLMPLDEVEDMRESWGVFRDRRPQMYKNLL